MSDFRRRLFEEYTSLHAKLTNLDLFMVTEEFQALPDVDRKDIAKQRGHMKDYETVLGRRVSRLCNNA
jgi:hypothetical protein